MFRTEPVLTPFEERHKKAVVAAIEACGARSDLEVCSGSGPMGRDDVQACRAVCKNPSCENTFTNKALYWAKVFEDSLVERALAACIDDVGSSWGVSAPVSFQIAQGLSWKGDLVTHLEARRPIARPRVGSTHAKRGTVSWIRCGSTSWATALTKARLPSRREDQARDSRSPVRVPSRSSRTWAARSSNARSALFSPVMAPREAHRCTLESERPTSGQHSPHTTRARFPRCGRSHSFRRESDRYRVLLE